MTRAFTPVRILEGVTIFELTIDDVFRRQISRAHAVLMSLWGTILLTSAVVILAVVPAAEANLPALHVKSTCWARLLLVPARLCVQSWVRPHIMALDVGLKIPLVFEPRVIAVVLVKLISSKLLLFLGDLNGFGVRLALPVQEKETLLPHFGTVMIARGELSFSRLELDGWLKFLCRLIG